MKAFVVREDPFAVHGTFPIGATLPIGHALDSRDFRCLVVPIRGLIKPIPGDHEFRRITGLSPDVLVVGAGNAALCAAISAHESGARVLMLEGRAVRGAWRQLAFHGGAFRFAFSGVNDLIAVLPSLAQENLDDVDFGAYAGGFL